MKAKEVDDLEVKSNKKKKHRKDKPKKEKKSKLQHTHWKAPFQPSSNLHKVSQAMMKKGGMAIKAFNKFVKKCGGKASWLLKCMRKGSAGAWSWDFDDSHDRYRITNVRLNGKKVK